MSLAEQLDARGIRLKSYKPGTHHTTCPKCSHHRKKKTSACLTVTIEEGEAVWFCHHCNDKGSTKEKTNYADTTSNPNFGGTRPGRRASREAWDRKQRQAQW